MSLNARSLTPLLSVSAQIDAAAVAEAAAAGYRSIINNRPDFEHGPDQPTGAEIEAAAHAAGLQYRHLPVDGAHQTPEQIAAFGQLLQELPTPILAFCRSGARSTKLFVASQQPF